MVDLINSQGIKSCIIYNVLYYWEMCHIHFRYHFPQHINNSKTIFHVAAIISSSTRDCCVLTECEQCCGLDWTTGQWKRPCSKSCFGKAISRPSAVPLDVELAWGFCLCSRSLFPTTGMQWEMWKWLGQCSKEDLRQTLFQFIWPLFFRHAHRQSWKRIHL